MRTRYAYEKGKRPSSVFDNTEEALDALCRGCVRETGWLDDPMTYDTPLCALGIIDDDPGSICEGHDGPACPRREKECQRVHQAEKALYEKRMKGDWT